MVGLHLALSLDNGGYAGFEEEGAAVLQGLLPSAVAGFDTFDEWQLTAEFVEGNGRVLTLGPVTANQSVTYSGDVALPSGPVWVALDQVGATGGGLRAQLQSPQINGTRSNRRDGVTVEKFQNVSSGHFRLLATTGYDGQIKSAQAVDMGAILAQPCDIYIAAGQSLMAAQSSSYPIDTDQGDGWRDPQALYICPVANNTFKLTAGALEASVCPMQTQNGNSFGVSPAHAFQTAMLDSLPAGRNIVILQTAVGGTSLIGADAPWNPDGSTGNGGVYYNGMVSGAQAALASLPVGSEIKGLLWAQGQADNGVNIGDVYPPAFTALLARLRSDLTLSGLPAVVFGPNASASTWDDLGAAQATLDQDSGHANAIANVIYVPGPAGFDEDGTHITAAGSRAHGRDAATAFLGRLSP